MRNVSPFFLFVPAVTAYKGMGYGFDRAEDSPGYSVEKVEEYTLEDLGGLDTTISGAGDGVARVRAERVAHDADAG